MERFYKIYSFNVLIIFVKLFYFKLLFYFLIIFYSIHFQENTDSDGKTLKKAVVQSEKTVNRGPYKYNQPKK